MAGSINKAPLSSANHLLNWLKGHSNNQSIPHGNCVQYLRSVLSTAYVIMAYDIPQSRSFTSRNNFLVPAVKVKGSTSMTQRGVTSIVMSNLWAGDLHILESVVNVAMFDIRSKRTISGIPTRRSATHYYDVLGLNASATQSQIKGAFYKMSKLHHPDVTECTKSHAIFNEVNEAYEILGNLRRRRMYDRGVFNIRDTRADSEVDDEEKDYTQAYKERSIFQRGDRPPPPTGRSKIYNFDEYYRMHYNDLRERRANEYREYIKHKERMDSHTGDSDSTKFVLLGGLIGVFLLLGIMLTTDYDKDMLQKSQKK